MKLEDLSVKTLQERCQRIYYFGLGFIQVKLNEIERLHFYSKELPIITEDIHDHRYAFESTVLTGNLRNIRWDVDFFRSDSLPTHIAYYETCSPVKMAEPPEPEYCYCIATKKVEQLVGPGETYKMELGDFHQVVGDECITYLRRGPLAKPLARIVTEIGKKSVCAFSQKIPENELWRLIGGMLDANRS